MAWRMKVAPSVLLAEDPDMLSTLLAVINHHDAEAKRRAEAARRRR